ncbi:MAG: putative lipid II flippase FtsW [Oscillospiraceae bacterium]|nr:putative lipid II flippase FtsW [Oscillospiraceae bacterium]
MAEKRTNYIIGSGVEGSGRNITVSQGTGRKAKKEAKKAKKTREPGLRLIDGSMDPVFFVIVIVMLVYGLIMVFSASYIEALTYYDDGYRFVRTQGIAAIIGVVVMLFVSFFDYHILMNSNVVVIGYLAMLGLLTYTSFFGTENAEARRWIEIGSFSFQPSEAMKPVLIIFTSFLCVKLLDNPKRQNMPLLRKYFSLLLTLALVCFNMVLQRHISGLLIMGAIWFCVVLLSGIPYKDIAKMAVIIAVGGISVLLLYAATREGGLSYISDRLTSMSTIDEGVITDDNWQTMQSLIAIGSGGWFGLGFGESRQKYLWLPEAQNDMIISVIVEELGYIGGLVVIILFALLVYRGFRIARKAPDKFGMLITSGITFQIGLQAILNIGVACNAFPNTGVTLPFFSYGGSALMIQLVEMGVILGVSRQCENI